MNYLAHGGELLHACRAVFRATPVNAGIPFVAHKYSDPVEKYIRPTYYSPEDQYNNLITSNLKVETGMTKPAGRDVFTIY